MSEFYGDDRNLYALVVSVCFAAFALLFVIAWVASSRFSETFRSMSLADKADWCSRINSTVHGVVVVIGFIATLSKTSWNHSTMEPYPSTDLTNVRCIMSVALGYFAFDFIVVLGFRVPLFYVFVVHHIVASLPFYLHLFVWQCDFATMVLGSFLCVELATVFLNAQTWCAQVTGRKDTTLYRTLFGMTYVSWIVSRIGLPVFCLTFFNHYLIVGDPGRPRPLGCLIPITACGYIISIFCTAVFLFVLTPELYRIVTGQDANPPPVESCDASTTPDGNAPNDGIVAFTANEPHSHEEANLHKPVSPSALIRQASEQMQGALSMHA